MSRKEEIVESERRIMLMNNLGTDICYNAQAAIDSYDQIIVACLIRNCEVDHNNFISVYGEVVQN